MHILLRRMVRQWRAYILQKKLFANNLYHHIFLFVRLPAISKQQAHLHYSQIQKIFFKFKSLKNSVFLEDIKT